MIAELLEAYAGKWTFHHHLYNHADKLGLLGKIKIDPIAEILYPPRDFFDWEKEEACRAAAADQLASQLKDRDPISVAEVLAPIEDRPVRQISRIRHGETRLLANSRATDNPVRYRHCLRVVLRHTYSNRFRRRRRTTVGCGDQSFVGFENGTKSVGNYSSSKTLPPWNLNLARGESLIQ
jgi:hypothetical protein